MSQTGQPAFEAAVGQPLAVLEDEDVTVVGYYGNADRLEPLKIIDHDEDTLD